MTSTSAGRRVLVRVDLNVPVENGVVTDTTRIARILPTLRDIEAKGGMPVLLSHFGRPKGQVVPAMSLAQVLPALQEAVGRPVAFCPETDPEAVRARTLALKPGEILLLENTRFYPGEEKNDPALARSFASWGDVFCNDAFSAAHRAHASTVGVAQILPACAGRLMEAELRALEAALEDPARPLVAVVGGAKVSTKLALLGNLIGRVDRLVIGGGMANTFLAAQGVDVGRSLCEHDLADTAREIMAQAAARGCALLLPVDAVVAEALRPHARAQVVDIGHVPRDMMILDAGPRSVVAIERAFEAARTLVWNGPLGAFEVEPFNAATDAAALKAADLTEAGRLVSVAGGGDTVAALNRSGAAARFSYVSTAGGAFLEWLEGKTLPGVAVLMQQG
ncbi:MAG: phosphoglycerate kinase [Paracoccaceae bacterium]|nr:MAG: phosphoglycerate kinase [Paracoccaceae bacterium]